jgi:hypothetical protein
MVGADGLEAGFSADARANSDDTPAESDASVLPLGWAGAEAVVSLSAGADAWPELFSQAGFADGAREAVVY